MYASLLHPHANGATHDTAPGQARTLMVGAGAAGRTLARNLLDTPSVGLRPIGFLDDARHRKLERLPVFGPLAALEQTVRNHDVDVVIVAIPSLPPIELAALLRTAAQSGAMVRYLPSFHAAVQRGSRAEDLCVVSPASLLGRQERQVVRPATRATVHRRRVLVTGAGGSIGSELCRQIASYGPAALYLLDHDESNLHRLALEIDGTGTLDSDELLVADIRDRRRIRSLVATLRPHVVYHAAAHKHLPLLERHPCEGVKSNVLGTMNVVDAAVDYGAERFILISTDKAAEPTSVLGATKLLAEHVVRSRAGRGTSVGAVRFGNVLGSRGSFLNVIAFQMANHQPVTVTDPDVERFFMTVEEAVGLVLEAGAMAESGETFVLDMGTPVRITSLVEVYAAQAGIDSYEMCFTGLRPGEKLSEALFSAAEDQLSTAHPRITAARSRLCSQDLDADLATLYRAAADNDVDAVRDQLAAIVPDYRPPVADAAGRTPLFNALYPDDF